MWDALGWGGETQALAYDPRAKKDRDFCYGDPAFPPEEPVAGHHGEDDYGIAW